MASLASGPGSIWGRSDSTHLAWGLLGGKDSKYICVKLIGYGSYGVVWSAINGETMEKVAVKVIPDAFADATAALRTLREVMLLRQIRHPNVVVLKDMKIPGSVANFKEVYLVYELMDTDLRNVITSKCPLSPDHIKSIVFQILCGLKYLHSANVLHRDLKPANLFLNSNCDLKIGDFGFARTAFPGTDCVLTEYVTTRWYGAPELLLGCSNYGAAVDVWSVGCILAELLGREPIFPGQDFRDQLILIHELLGSQKEEDLEFVEDPSSRTFINSLPSAHKLEFSRMYEHADPLATDLLERMLVFNPNKRISAAEALEHPYLAGLNDPNLNLCGEHPIVSLDQEDGMKELELRKMMFTEMLHNLPRRHSRA